MLLGNGAGSFGGATSFATGLLPSGLAAADLDRDGDLDLATANQNAPANSVSILPGDGNGSFGAKTDLPAGSTPLRSPQWRLRPEREAGSGVVEHWLEQRLGVPEHDHDRLRVAAGLRHQDRLRDRRRAARIAAGDFDRDGNQDVLTAGITGDNSRC